MKNVSLLKELNDSLPSFGVMGVPGTGKTTISKKIGEILGRDVVNVDATLKQKTFENKAFLISVALVHTTLDTKKFLIN